MNKKQKIIISVTNDLVADNRVHKVADSLIKFGFEILLVGRKLPGSLHVNREYKTKRFKLLFNKGAMFYAFYNIRLFFFLLFAKADIFLSNDLDTLPANFIASKIRNKKLVYDSHEYFTEVPELVNRPKIKRIWENTEKRILPKIKFLYTVCNSIADIYNKKYGINMKVVRNIPECEKVFKYEKPELPEDITGKKIIL
ncbi:MAG: glycosyltransferase [Bacteroidales bacterium]|nr:glycosyltransferase [Bacteroidales bacterium]